MTNRKKRTFATVAATVAVLVLAAGIAWAAAGFPDVSASDPHVGGIQWASDNDIVTGYENGSFGPYDNIKRGQAATMFMRYDTYLRSSLDGCHAGSGFSGAIAAGENPGQYVASAEEVVNPTRQDCRACHQVHEKYTTDDWALETTAAVELYPYEGDTFEGGEGNLCANCHQPRHLFPEYVVADGTAEVTSSHWGPHHGPQAAMLLGQAGAGDAADGSAHTHYTLANTCVTCHLGENDDHSFEPSTAACTTCHGEVDD